MQKIIIAVTIIAIVIIIIVIIVSDSDGADWTGPHTLQAGNLQTLQVDKKCKVLTVHDLSGKIKVTKNLNLGLLSYNSRSFFFYFIKLFLNKGQISISQQETWQITKADNCNSCTFLLSFYFFIWTMKGVDEKTWIHL